MTEYWIVDPHDKTVMQYVLSEGQYELVLKSGEGIIRSRVVAGFNIPIAAMFDSATTRNVLRLILTDGLND